LVAIFRKTSEVIIAMKPIAALSLLMGLLAVLPLAWAQQPMDHMHHMDQGQPAAMPPPGGPEPGLPPDTRELVHFPVPLRDHTMASMRDHLLTLQRLQEALATGKFDEAAKLAEARLGLSSFGLHQAHEVAKYMPKGMQEAGNAMHRAASRFAIAAQTAGATGEVKPALEALSQVTMACVSCHAGYRLH
jgi:hypothetical protein